MPALAVWIFGGLASVVSGLTGFIVGGGVSGFSRALMWAAIGFLGYIGAKHFEVI